jgi:hypothetical protein
MPQVAGAQTPVNTGSEELRRHDQISLLEGTLVGAVKVAASRVAKDVQARTPSANLFTGDARAKGFILDGYGVFVYVEIPALDLQMSVLIDQLERNLRSAANADTANRADPSSTAREALREVQDTGERYRAAVKKALAEAMLDHSKNLELKPDEWLSVAARGSESALLPGEVLQLTTVVLRVKGSDLVDYLAGKLTKEQALEKVEVRQF